MCIIILDVFSLKVTASNVLAAVAVLKVNPRKWKKESLLLTEFVKLKFLLCSFKNNESTDTVKPKIIQTPDTFFYIILQVGAGH